jgi:hypothetical protein
MQEVCRIWVWSLSRGDGGVRRSVLVGRARTVVVGGRRGRVGHVGGEISGVHDEVAAERTAAGTVRRSGLSAVRVEVPATTSSAWEQGWPRGRRYCACPRRPSATFARSRGCPSPDTCPLWRRRSRLSSTRGTSSRWSSHVRTARRRRARRGIAAAACSGADTSAGERALAVAAECRFGFFVYRTPSTFSLSHQRVAE